MEPGYCLSPVRQPVPGYLARGPCLRCGRAVELRAAGPGGRFDVLAAEDDHEPDIGPTTTPDQPDDAVDDADHVRRVHMAVPGWPGRLHPVLKHYWRSNSVLRRWQTTNRTVRTIVPGYGNEQG